MPFFKIGSGDTNNLAIVTKTAKKGRPMVVSSGMQSLETMKKVFNAFHTEGECITDDILKKSQNYSFNFMTIFGTTMKKSLKFK